MKKILLLNFCECPENMHFEQAFIRALRRRGGAALDILHDFDHIYSFIKKQRWPGARRFKYCGQPELAGKLAGAYDLLVLLDFPKRKRCALPFMKLALRLKAGGKFFVANHLSPMPGQNFAADTARRLGFLSGFDGASILDADDVARWSALGFEEGKLSRRNYAVDCSYYRPVPVIGGDYVFSAGSAGRDFKVLALAAKKAGLPLKIFSDDKNVSQRPCGPGRETGSFSANLHRIREVIAASRLVVVPIKDGHGNLSAGNTIIFMAMACGKPVLARRNQYTERFIKDGENGFLYDALSVRSIGGGLERILSVSRAGLARLGRAARKTVLRKASLDAFCASLVKKII